MSLASRLPRPISTVDRSPRAVFGLRVERVRVALHGALARERGDAPAEEARAGELAQLDATLAPLERRRSPAQWLAERLALAPEAVDFLWTAVALDADPRLLPLAQRLCGTEVRRGATPALHAAVFGLDAARGRALAGELDGKRELLRARFLTPTQENGLLSGTPFLVPSRVRAFLLGLDDVDPLLARHGGPLPAPGELILDERQERCVRELMRALDDDGPLLVVVEGLEGGGRRTAVARAAAAVGRTVVELDAGRWEPRATSLDALVATWWRECLLRGAVPLVSRVDAPPAEARRQLAVLLDELDGVVVATTRAAAADLSVRRPLLRLALAAPDTTTRRALWAGQLSGGAPAADLDLLAHRYALGPGGIASAARAARLRAGDGPLTTSALVAGVRSSVGDRIGDLAVRLPVTQSWDDLVLSADTHEQVRALVARVRHARRVLDVWGFGAKLARGQGVAALLSGPPGTGKTMVAGLIARELELDLLQVDLSKVVSKWVGETEKQLGAVFDAAEAGHCLLLFDEADALFAKRTEVKGASDRYANLEVSYLLSRVETFGGVTLLTTNFETAIDAAVKRRLAAHITFWPPDEEERTALWRRMVPAAAPVAGDLDFAALAARFPDLHGAHIRNAAVAAAFLAADDDAALSQAYLERAARAEYSALGRVISTKGR